MKKIGLWMACILFISGCSRYERVEEPTAKTTLEQPVSQNAVEVEPMVEIISEPIIQREPVRVKGVYVSAHVAGSTAWIDEIISQIDATEVNAVVIDVKDDSGRITFAVDSPLITELDACKNYIGDIRALMEKLKEHEIYTIARVVAFRDPYLAEKKPEWSLKLEDGSLYRDNKGLAWVNPYKSEVWDYLVEVGIEAAKVGFDEIQFDYIRFSTEKGMKNVVFDEADTRGRSKTDIITEFTDYVYDKLAEENLFVAADVFGAIIGSEVDADSVGQIYGNMAKNLDYICPMIYPSHYGNGSFGVEYPDKKPYEIILAALKGSQVDLMQYEQEGETQAIVRPWLQDFTASYLKNYIPYGNEQIRAQINGVYDAGYDEWILWCASCKYHWGALLTEEEGQKEYAERQERRKLEAEKQEQESRE